jgi:NAD(P)H dehydrogenase (quinone)
MAVRVAVIYYSSTGVTYQLANALAEGARGAGADVALRKVRELAPDEAILANQGWSDHRRETQAVLEATLQDLVDADAIAFGAPTRYGSAAAQLKQFIDTTGPLWGQGKLVDKVVTAFTSAATAHGGHETTLASLYNTFHHWGCIVVAPGYADPVQFQSGNPYGASFTSANGTLPADETALASARFQGRRLAQVAQQFLAGGAVAAAGTFEQAAR